uniref:Uncharacterized protein n=1 Tax=viral metagenome TaxID=1070528 RepID=A0A6C0KCC4_9ZZZZ
MGDSGRVYIVGMIVVWCLLGITVLETVLSSMNATHHLAVVVVGVLVTLVLATILVEYDRDVTANNHDDY